MNSILVVDDEPQIVQLCKRVFESDMMSVSVAHCADEAMDILRHKTFDLVMTDLRMPGSSGVTLLEKIIDSYPQTAVIVITGQGTIESAIEIMKKGAYDYILKPFNIEDLRARVMKCIEHNRLVQEEYMLREILYLYQFTKEMNEPQSEKELLEYIVHHVVRAFKADTGSILMLTEEKDKMLIMASYGSKTAAIGEVRSGDSVAGWVAKTRQPIIIQGGFQNTPQFSNLHARSEIASSIIVPLMNQEIVVGVICIARLAEKASTLFTEKDMESLKLFVVHATMILSALRHNLALKELSKLKTEFVSNVSHELRTPLMSIGGAIDLLRDFTAPYSNDEKVNTFLNVIDRNAKRMHNLVNDLLDFSRIETRQLVLRTTTFDLKGVILETVQDAKERAAKKKLSITVNEEDKSVEVTADRERIIQVIVNLIENAIKFTPEGGGIRIKCNDCEDGAVEMVVNDSGKGVPEDQREKIFKEFYQVDGSSSRAHAGFGLGLAIVKSIVQAHNGKVWVDSEGGNGASFHVKIPRTQQGEISKSENR